VAKTRVFGWRAGTDVQSERESKSDCLWLIIVAQTPSVHESAVLHQTSGSKQTYSGICWAAELSPSPLPSLPN
jgi:hypothetical protein